MTLLALGCETLLLQRPSGAEVYLVTEGRTMCRILQAPPCLTRRLFSHPRAARPILVFLNESLRAGQNQPRKRGVGVGN
jgi:hypothetical protein